MFNLAVLGISSDTSSSSIPRSFQSASSLTRSISTISAGTSTSTFSSGFMRISSILNHMNTALLNATSDPIDLYALRHKLKQEQLPLRRATIQNAVKVDNQNRIDMCEEEIQKIEQAITQIDRTIAIHCADFDADVEKMILSGKDIHALYNLYETELTRLENQLLQLQGKQIALNPQSRESQNDKNKIIELRQQYKKAKKIKDIATAAKFKTRKQSQKQEVATEKKTHGQQLITAFAKKVEPVSMLEKRSLESHTTDHSSHKKVNIEKTTPSVKTSSTKKAAKTKITPALSNAKNQPTINQLFQKQTAMKASSGDMIQTPHPGLTRKRVLGDGNCFYYAVQLTQSAIELRRMVAEEIRSHHEQYVDFIKGNDWKKYADLVEKTKEWADNVEIMALTKILNRPIIVINPQGKTEFLENLVQYSGAPIFVYYNGSDHYDALTLNGTLSAQDIIASLGAKSTPSSPNTSHESISDDSETSTVCDIEIENKENSKNLNSQSPARSSTPLKSQQANDPKNSPNRSQSLITTNTLFSKPEILKSPSYSLHALQFMQ